MNLENRTKLKKKGKKGLSLLVLLLISTTILLAGCIGQSSPPAPTFVTTPSTTSVTTTPEVTTPTTSAPEEKEPPNKILFIGDEFTFRNKGLDYHMKNLAHSVNPPLDIEVDSVVYCSVMVSLKVIWFTTNAGEVIEKGDYDVVVLQEDLDKTNDVDTYYEYVRKFDAMIKAAGAETMLFMTWPWEASFLGGNYQIYCGELTTEEIAQANYDIATELSIDVAPVGLAWQRAMDERPDLDLYAEDGVNPSIYGTYLTTIVIYATIFGESPIGLAYLGDKPDLVDLLLTEEEAAFLQRIAWETVQEYPA